MKKITPEKFWELYKTLPQELKGVLCDPKTGDNIFEICQKNNIPQKTEEISDCVAQVLIGVLPPDEFQEVLEKELKINPEVAKKVNQEIYRFIFFPVKASLEELYKKGLIPIAQPSKIYTPLKERSKEKTIEDIYREPIE